MSRGFGRCVALGFVLSASVVGMEASVRAQTNDRGFSIRARASATGEELTQQPGLWICEVTFKPLRFMTVEITDPKTGKKARELVWYLCYKAINRPLGGEENNTDRQPVNDDDKPPSKPMFVPEFTLVSEDEDEEQKIYQDVVIPEAQAAILKREQRREGDPRLKNSVEVIGPVPEPTEAEVAPGQTIWGVAIFRGVDPKIDRFSIFMTGFSNGFKVIKGPDGEDLVLRRTLRQEFYRPGDEFAQQETEFRAQGDPVWSYRPEDVRNKEAAQPIDGKAAEPAAEKAEPNNDNANQ